MTRLSAAALDRLPAAVRGPRYDRNGLALGVLHLGPGAFHRAHQASYFDDLACLGDARWGVVGVSLNSVDVADALTRQDGLYTLIERGEGAPRVIGAVRQVLAARRDPKAVMRRFVDPALNLITLTVTEKGYPLDAAGDFDPAYPGVAADLARPEQPTSPTGWLVAGLAARRAKDLPPPTVLSCDNLDDNGGKLGRAVVAHARRIDPGLADWIAREVSFPRTMVDSITPAADETLLEEVLGLGLEDAAPVQRETYRQWVIESQANASLDALRQVGVVLTDDVGAHAEAKLRLLNATHSLLAYLGGMLGHETVAQAMADPLLSDFCTVFMDQDVIPGLRARDLDLPAYAASIRARLANPRIDHRLSQIGQDGSSKLSIRLTRTIQAQMTAGRNPDRAALGVAAWMHQMLAAARSGGTIIDPLASQLNEIGRVCPDGAEATVELFCQRVLPPTWRGEPRFTASLVRAYRALGDALAVPA